MKKVLAGLLCLCMGLGTIPTFAEEKEEMININFDDELKYESYKLTYFDEGVKGKSVWFNGGTSYVKVPDDINKGVTDYTFSAWIKMTGLEKGWQRIFDFGSGTDNYVYFGIPSNTKNLRVAYKINGSDEWNVDAENVTKLNEWMHVALVQEGKMVKIYVDGEKVAEKECEYTLSDLGETRSNYIGKSQFTADPRLNAYVDEVLLVNEAYKDIASLAVKPEKKLTEEDILNAVKIEGNDSVKGNITLPDEVLGYKLTWESSDESVINTTDIENGNYVIPKGKVTRQNEDVKVALTASVYIEDGKILKKEIPVTVIKKPAPVGETVGYLYVYFRGFVNGSDEHLSIHIAGSEDGYNWFDLNENKPILESKMGTYELRDPYLLRSIEGDRFYLIATDLNTKDGQGWGPWSLSGSKYLMVWESDDLINWSEQRMVKFANDEIGCAWAPEAIWDPDTEEYLVYASGKDLTLENPQDTVYVVRTRDFRSFTEPEYFVKAYNAEGGRIGAIDSNIIHANDGKFYHFYKKSGHIEMMVSDHASGPYEYIDEFPRPNGEGPGSFLVKGTDDTYALMVDDYSVYVPYLTDDIASGKFTKATDTITMPTGSKHGGFLPLNEEEYNRVMDAWYYISRVEAVERMMVKAGYGESEIQAFTDCDNGYVNKAFELGIVKGNENGLFEPDRPITGIECALFASRLIGEDDEFVMDLFRHTSNDAHMKKVTYDTFKTFLNSLSTTKDGVEMNGEIEKIRAEEKENPDRIKEVKEKAITYGDVTMKYTMSIMGEEPLEGYPVYIALHGGGGSDTPDLNDSQWKAMQTYYRGSVESGIYIAPRGVRDTWDTHFNPESYYCYQRLIQNLAIFYNINPDRIYLVGYSAGGDGVYQISARMADFLAAANMSAGHPNGVDLTNVKNMPLYLQCGELDTAYDRNKVTEEYGKNDNVAGVFIHKNKPHNFIDNGTELQQLTDGTFKDTNAIRLVSKHVRNPYPEKIEWNLSLKKSDMFYYVESAATEGAVMVERDGNTFTVTGDADAIYVNNSFVDVEKPIVVVYNGEEKSFEYKFDLKTVEETYQKRFDKSLTFTMKINLKEN